MKPDNQKIIIDGNEKICGIYNEYTTELQDALKNTNSNFSISILEEKLNLANKRTQEAYIDVTSDILNSVDETNLILQKKKKEYEAKGIKLVVKDTKERSILTTQGKLIYSRKILRPYSSEDELKLKHIENIKSVVPLDIFLKIDGLPFKISPKFMLEIAHHAIKSDSYVEAQGRIYEIYHQKINHETIRSITNLVGRLVYDYDCQKADEAMNLHIAKEIQFKDVIDGILYIEMDGSFINTRIKNNENSTWVESKLCIIFNSNNLLQYRTKDGDIAYRINKAEYISFIGSVDEFKKHVLALALRNRYNLYKHIVVLSDGAPWIKKFKEEFFPMAQQILDIYHLYENTSKFLNAVCTEKNKIESYREKWFEWIDQGQCEKIIKDLDKFKDKKIPDDVVNLGQYILNNKDNVDYPYYRLIYKFIGSGAIESGNKYVVQRRLKLSGMRWSKEYAQYLLSLRCKEYSGMWYLVEDIFRSYFPM